MADSEHESSPVEELRPIFNQTRIEHEMLSHAHEALVAAIEWQTVGDTFTRKLSSLRFAWMAYQQHLERVLAIEECDGYINFICDETPHLSDQVNVLRSEHDHFRDEMKVVATTLERLQPTDHVALQAVVQRIVDLLRGITDHSQREMALLQTALNEDLGTGD